MSNKLYEVAQTYLITHIYEVEANNQEDAIDKVEKYLYDPPSVDGILHIPERDDSEMESIEVIGEISEE